MRALDRPQRHDRAWLKADWREFLLSSLASHDEAIARDWIVCGRPLVVARSLPDDPAGGIRLGLALPGKRRLGMVVEQKAIARLAPPMLLEETISTAPLRWRKPLGELISEFALLGLSLRVFGSLTWHCFAAAGSEERDTGYLTSTSDIDLLAAPRTMNECATACRVLAEFEVDHPALRLDGEFSFPDASAVSWREFASHPPHVLVKRTHEVVVLPFSSLEGLFVRMAA